MVFLIETLPLLDQKSSDLKMVDLKKIILGSW